MATDGVDVNVDGFLGIGIVEPEELADDEFRDGGDEGHPDIDDAAVEEKGGEIRGSLAGGALGGTHGGHEATGVGDGLLADVRGLGGEEERIHLVQGELRLVGDAHGRHLVRREAVLGGDAGGGLFRVVLVVFEETQAGPRERERERERGRESERGWLN